MELSKNTKMTVSIGTLIAVTAFGWTLFQTADAYMDAVMTNSESIQVLKAGLRLNTLDDQIGDLKRERREIREKVRDLDPLQDASDINAYESDIDEIEDELERLEKIRECVIRMDAKVCE